MENNWFTYQTIFLKIVSMQTIKFLFLPPRLFPVNILFNIIFRLFWHFVVIHLAVLQIQTVILNLDKSLDEVIDYAMIGSIYSYGYWILIYWQYNSRKLMNLMDFAEKNFQLRSAKGKYLKSFSKLLGFELFKSFNIAYSAGLTFVSFDGSIKLSNKLCCVWVLTCLAGEWLLVALETLLLN